MRRNESSHTYDRGPRMHPKAGWRRPYGRLAVIAAFALVALLLAPVSPADPPTANSLLLNTDPLSATLRPTATTVRANRFAPSTTVATSITDVKFAVGTLRTDAPGGITDQIPEPLRMSRNGIEWDEYNLLLSGIGFTRTGTTSYSIGVQQSMGRYLNARVMVPVSGWNGRLYFWHHGSTDTSLLAFTSAVEPELLLKRGWAVAMADFQAPVAAQQNPNASDESFWKSIDEFYLADPALYWSYAAHPTWWSNPNGVALSDSATLRNIVGVVKNLLYREQGQQPSRSYWFGWSAGGPSGTALNTGRDSAGNYTGGGFNDPYNPASGKVFDGFIAMEPTFTAAAPGPDPVYPIVSPYIFVDGTTSPLSLVTPNALSISRKVKVALDNVSCPCADPTLSKNVNDWIKLYTQKYGNHDWSGRFFDVLYSGDSDPLYYDVAKPLAQRINDQGSGRKFNWIMTKMARNSPVYLQDWADENKPGWGQLHSAYYQLNDGYFTRILTNLTEWVEGSVAPPASRIDPYLMLPTTTSYPNLPVNDPTQDNLILGAGTNVTAFNAAQLADLAWLRTDPGALSGTQSLVVAPHLAARWGIYNVNYKVMLITPFTSDQLVNGYNTGNISFPGYANYGAYISAFDSSLQGLVDERLYDMEIADSLMGGDEAIPRLPFPDTVGPTATPTQSPAAVDGWNNADVTIDWNWADEAGGAGIDPDNCTTTTTTSGEGDPITVEATCNDMQGNEGTASYDVRVDKTPPVFAFHPDVYDVTGDYRGRTVTYTTPDVSDNLDPAPVVSCSRASGAVFPVGRTRIDCSATDAAGNDAEAFFHVVVTLDAALAAQALEDDVDGAEAVKKGLRTELTVKLDNVQKEFAKQNPKATGACKDLDSFLKHVAARTGKDGLSAEQATVWRDWAEAIKGVLEC